MKKPFEQSDLSVNDKQINDTNHHQEIESTQARQLSNVPDSELNSTSNNTVKNNGQVIIGSAHNAQQLLEVVQVTPTPWYYSLLLGIAAPFYRLKISLKSGKNANYEQEVGDRFGQRYLKPFQWSVKSQETEENGGDSVVDSTSSPIIWCHAVSLGETNTIAPVLDRLLAIGCRVWMTNTTHTGYKRTAQRFSKQIATGQLHHGYVPIDKDNVIECFLNHVQPTVAMFVETELWGNSLHQLSKRNIPSVLINARLSEKSFLGYLKFGKLSQSMMQNIGLIITQDRESARRFRDLGAESAKIRVVGSLKWTVNPVNDTGMSSESNDSKGASDILTEIEKLILSEKRAIKNTTAERKYTSSQKKATHVDSTLDGSKMPKGKKVKSDKYATKKNINPKLTIAKNVKQAEEVNQTDGSTLSKNASSKNTLLENILTVDSIKNQAIQAINHRPVWVVASTHEGEEAVALAAHQKLLQLATFSDTLLIVVPRHPERFDNVAVQIETSGLRYCRRSKNELPTQDIQVYLADSMGELAVWYELADVAFVGGSMVNIGGHNPVEALAMATPVIMGKYTQSCQMIVDELRHAEVLQQLSDDYQLKKQGKNAKVLNQEHVHQLSESLYQAVKVWLNNPERTAELGEKGKQLVFSKQSVINRQMQIVLDILFNESASSMGRPNIIVSERDC